MRPFNYKDILGYLVTEDGKLYDINKNKFVKPKIHYKGYLYYQLNDKYKKPHIVFAHRLVALAYLPAPEKPEYNCIDHIDCNKLNNHYTNLRWVDNTTNMRAAFHNGLYDNRDMTGCKNNSNVYTEDQIKEVIRLLIAGFEISSIAVMTQVKESTVRAVKNKRQWGYLTKDLDFGDSLYEKRLSEELKQQLCEDIKLKLTEIELQEKYGLNIPTIRYFKQKVKYNF